jgi:hypothetical protein
MIFGTPEPLSDKEMVEVRQYAEERIRLWRKRSLYSVGALLLSSASVIPFSKRLSSRLRRPFRETFSLPFDGSARCVCLCTGFYWAHGEALRDVEKGQTCFDG